MVLKPFYFLFAFLVFTVSAQELPPIQNYTPIEYEAGNQNWSFAQSQNQRVYIANNNGLLEFNGTSWKLYQAPFGTPVKSVSAVGDRIYTGSYMEFGFWKSNELGVLSYSSLSKDLEIPLIDDEDFWNIISFKDWVLFQSLDRIYIYNSKTNLFEIFEVTTSRAKIFKVNNKIYFQNGVNGLFTLKNGTPILVSDHDVFKNETIVGAFSVEDRMLVITETGNFFYYDYNTLKEWKISADVNLTATKIYSTLKLDDGSYILGTISKGIYHISENGTLIYHVNQEKGLNNNTVLSLYEDIDHNLWLGLDNGLSILNLNSPFKQYVDHLGTLGVVYTADKIKGTLYLGTNQGLFYKKDNENSDFQMVKGTEGQVWMLKEIQNTLFCGHHNGTYVINDTIATKISNYPGTWDIQPIHVNSKLLVQGNYKGLSVLKFSDGQWIFKNRIEGFDSSSRFFEFSDTNELLVNHDYKGIYRLELNTDYTEVLKVSQIPSKGNGSSLMRFKDDIVYATINGVYNYEAQQQDFIKDSILTGKFFNASDSIVGIVQSTNDAQRLWGFSTNNIISISTGQLTQEPEVVKTSIPNFFRRSMGVLGFESVVHVEKEEYLIGMSNGYVTLDLDKKNDRNYSLTLNGVTKTSYNGPKIAIPISENEEFEHSQNNISFSFHVAEFDRFTEVYYQYMLEGRYEQWSNWSSDPIISLENLSHGHYMLRVRAKVGNTSTINEISHSFIIKKPWYLSYWAILGYVFLAALLSVAIHRVYKNYYKKQQLQLIKENKKRLKRKKLKNQKKLVQVKNERLQELIDSKNRELAISTMSIIKKNEFLNSIKEKLKDSQDNSQVRSVIKTIDKNINNDEDWTFFENAFNNADKDFLKKIKDKHPELSSNDLRLCAYLRLNLSSKEIAPLLNISVRSVEVKRYRLRKKMNLLHEEGLTDYIINL
ncbi:helix-turn-helix and ligand-binding sensor domain-containing protein [Maribacter litoralis]|nr:triple tyrosine motif-containing protein [Maribacter litoralis]